MRKIGLIIVLILATAVFLSGCQETGTKVENPIDENVDIESDLVKLVHAKFIQVVENDRIKRVEVEYLLKNIVDRVISLDVIAEFYDNDGNLIDTDKKTIRNLPVGYTETDILPANVFTYDGLDAYKIDHVKITTTEL